MKHIRVGAKIRLACIVLALLLLSPVSRAYGINDAMEENIFSQVGMTGQAGTQGTVASDIEVENGRIGKTAWWIMILPTLFLVGNMYWLIRPD